MNTASLATQDRSRYNTFIILLLLLISAMLYRFPFIILLVVFCLSNRSLPAQTIPLTSPERQITVPSIPSVPTTVSPHDPLDPVIIAQPPPPVLANPQNSLQQSSPQPLLPTQNVILKKAVFPKHTTVAELENGLVLIIQENTLAPQVSVRCFISKTGSAYETDFYGCGLTANLLLQIAKPPIFGSISKETLSFGIDGTAEHWKSLIQQLALAIFQQPKFQQSNAAKTTFPGSASQSLDDLIEQTIYSELSLKVPVSGYPEQLAAIGTETVQEYAKKHLQTNNTVFVICGKIKTEEVLEYCNNLFGVFPKGTGQPNSSFIQVEQQSPRRYFVEQDRNSVELALIWPGTTISDPDRFALELIAVLLSEGQTSRLARRLNTDRPLALEWSSVCQLPQNFNGYFALKATVLPDYHETVVRTLLEEVYRFRDEMVSPDELLKAKRQKEAASLFSAQTIAQSADRLGQNYLATGDPTFEETVLQRVRNVSPNDIQRVARRFFISEKLNQVSLIPYHSSSVATTHNQPESTSEIQRFTLPNGIRLLGKKYTHLPVINIQATILGGDLLDSTENCGRATLFAAMLNQGSSKHTARELAESLEKRGATLSFSANRGTITANMMVLSDDFQQGIDLLADCLISPIFPDAPFAQIKARHMDTLLRRQDDPLTELTDFFAHNLPETTPYHLPLPGTMDAVSRLSVASLREYYQRCIVPNNMVLTVFGNIEPQHAEKIIANAFGRMRGMTTNRPIVLDRNNVFLQPIEGHLAVSKGTAAVMLGYALGNPANTRETAVFMLLQQLLGGGKNNISLNRENRTGGSWLSRDLFVTGLAQTAGCELWNGPTPGYFVLYASCSPTQLTATVSGLERCVERITSGLIGPDEFSIAKEQVIIAYMSGNSTLEEQAREAAQNELLGFELLGGPTLPDRINTLTLEEVVSVARKYLTRRILTTSGPP